MHILEDVGVPPEGHHRVGVALSPICPDSRPRWAKSRDQITRRCAKTAYLWPEPSRKPDSALSRHPSPGENSRAPWGSRAYHVRRPDKFGLLAPVVYLAGPSRDTAGGLLPHPFTHHLCRRISGHRLVCSLLHLTWRRACAAPPLGLLARAAFLDPDRVLASPDFALRLGREPGTQRRVGRPRPSSNYTSGARR